MQNRCTEIKNAVTTTFAFLGNSLAAIADIDSHINSPDTWIARWTDIVIKSSAVRVFKDGCVTTERPNPFCLSLAVQD